MTRRLFLAVLLLVLVPVHGQDFAERRRDLEARFSRAASAEEKRAILDEFRALDLPAPAPEREEAARTLRDAIGEGMRLANETGGDLINYGGQPGMGPGPEGELDATFWEHLGDYHFRSRDGARASEAVRAMFPTVPGQARTRLECHTMMMAILYRAILETIGDEAFDAAFADGLVIKSGDIEASGLSDLLVHLPEAKTDDLIAGDWVYFQNHADYLFKHPAGAWQGENAIYIGRRPHDDAPLFSGFGAADLTEGQMVDELVEAFNKDRTSADRRLALLPPAAQHAWLAAHAETAEDGFYFLDPSVFEGFDPADDEDRALAILAEALGYDDPDAVGDDFDLGFEAGTAWLQFYAIDDDFQSSITERDVPGITRVDRLDIDRVLELATPTPSPEVAVGS